MRCFEFFSHFLTNIPYKLDKTSEQGHKVGGGWQPFGDPFYPLFRAIVIRADNTLFKMPASSIFSWGVRTRQSLRLPAIRRSLPLFHIMLYARIPVRRRGFAPIGNASARSSVSTEDTEEAETLRRDRCWILEPCVYNWPAPVYNLLHIHRSPLLLHMH